MTSRSSTVAIVGPILGGNPGWVVSQGEILAELLEREGYEILITSRRPGRLPRLLDTIRSLVGWRNRIDVAIVMVFSGPAFHMARVSTWILARFGRPMILCLRGGNLPEYAARNERRVRRVFKRGAHIVSPSHYLVREATRLGFEARVIPNIVRLSFPAIVREGLRPRLMWMRTFHELYNPQMAIEVLARLRARGIDASLTMAGQDKGELSATESLTASLQMTDHVRFAGFLDEAGKLREFSDHDLFLHTNRVDNQPVSVLEAAAAGLAIVATDVGGMRDLLQNEESALFVSSEDVDGMTDAVIRLLEDETLAKRVVEGARAIALASTWDAVRSDWLGTISDASHRIEELVD